MSMHDDIKTVLVSEEQLKAKVAELGAQISRDLSLIHICAVQLTGQVRFCAGNGCLRQEMLPDALPRQLESAPQQVPFLPKKQDVYKRQQ